MGYYGISRRTLAFAFDGGGAALAPGAVCWLRLPCAFVARRWTLLADRPGSVAIDVRVGDYAAGKPGEAQSVTAGHGPALAAAELGEAGDLAAWSSVAWTGGALVAACIQSCAAITRAALIIEGTSIA